MKFKYAAALCFLGGRLVRAQGVEVSATFIVQNRNFASARGHHRKVGPGDVVVWLTPMIGGVKRGKAVPISNRPLIPGPHHTGPFRLVQKDKRFTPHLLVVPAGSNVEFPNEDPFFHNVFSLFNGKRFDLGMYESGTTRSVRFDREGVSYIFCNIHPEMGAVVIALRTPYYSISNPKGGVVIHGVPPGTYQLHIWSETAVPRDATITQQAVRVAREPVNLGNVILEVTADPMRNHKNKFGDDYLPGPSPSY